MLPGVDDDRDVSMPGDCDLSGSDICRCCGYPGVAMNSSKLGGGPRPGGNDLFGSLRLGNLVVGAAMEVEFAPVGECSWSGGT